MIKSSTLLRRVLKLAEKYPDAVYEKTARYCLYDSGRVKNGPDKEGCIIGQCLSKTTLRKMNSQTLESGCLLSKANVDALDNYVITDDGYLEQLGDIQYRQDEGACWSDACKGIKPPTTAKGAA